MRSKRSRKIPISQHQPKPKNAVTSRATQATISAFHTLLKRRARLNSRLADPASAFQHQLLEKDLRSIETEIESLGGLEAYQLASKLGQSEQRGGDSAKVLISWLKESRQNIKGLGAGYAPDSPQSKLQLLELGALTPNNYDSCSGWIKNTPIDLHSQHPDIKQEDFFERPVPLRDSDQFDVISCSLVLNFVPEPDQRGRMLSLVHKHLRQSENSLLFLVLPSPCIRNSRYISPTSLIAIMKSLGFELLKERYKEGGKVTYWLWGWRPAPKNIDERWSRKVLENDGPKRNNFAVLLPS